MFFDSWSESARVPIVGVLAYVALVLILRVSGKRTLSKMNAFDFVVTVALGSTLATILLNEDVSLAEGVTALALLVGLQYLVAWSAIRFTWFNRVVKSEPRVIFYRGEMLKGAMKAERVTEGEVLSAIRQHGFASLGSVGAVVIETSGEISVTGRAEEAAMREVLPGRLPDIEG